MAIFLKLINGIEISRSSPIGYKWVSEGSGLWIPWQDDKYMKGGGC